MTCSSCPPEIQKYGNVPVNVQWKIVRGDTAELNVSFFELDELTNWDTDEWSYDATAYDSVTGTSYPLVIEDNSTNVKIIALPETTELWGISYGSVVGELSFDLQVTINGTSGLDDIIWTPIIGTICVLGDVTGGSL